MSRTRRYRLVGAVILLPQVVLMSLWYCLNRELEDLCAPTVIARVNSHIAGWVVAYSILVFVCASFAHKVFRCPGEDGKGEVGMEKVTSPVSEPPDALGLSRP